MVQLYGKGIVILYLLLLNKEKMIMKASKMSFVVFTLYAAFMCTMLLYISITALGLKESLIDLLLYKN